jgi:hypothetical protein
MWSYIFSYKFAHFLNGDGQEMKTKHLSRTHT